MVSEFDFWNVGKHEWKEQGLLTGFLKKLSFEQMDHFEPKNGTLSNSGSAPNIFLKVCTMKGANGYMEIILMAFPKKSCLGQMGHLRLKMACPHNSASTVRIVLQCCTMEGAKRDMGIILMVFLKKEFGAIWSFWSKNGASS